MILCWESIWLIAEKAVRIIKDRHVLKASSIEDAWKCDLCGTIGKGDAASFFGLEEVEHFLESGCRGSLRGQPQVIFRLERPVILSNLITDIKSRWMIQ